MRGNIELSEEENQYYNSLEGRFTLWYSHNSAMLNSLDIGETKLPLKKKVKRRALIIVCEIVLYSRVLKLIGKI